MQYEAFKRVDLSSPRRLSEHTPRVQVTGLLTRSYPVRAEIDVAHMVFCLKPRCE